MKKKKIITLILSLVLLIFPYLFYGCYDQAITRKEPLTIHQGILDFQHYNLSNDVEGLNLKGEMEFYYGKWLITDKEKIEKTKPDAYIQMPCFWTEIKKEGEHLQKSGFATYRFLVINVPTGLLLTADSDYFYSTFRIYFDDVLIGQSGNPNKDEKEDKKDIRFTRKTTYTTKSDHFYVTIEVGNSQEAGLVKAPKIVSGSISQSVKRGKELILFLVLGLFVNCIIILSITFLIKDGLKKSLPRFISSLFLFSYWLFSTEGLTILKLINIPNISYPFYKTFSIISLVLFMLSCFIWLTAANRSKRKKIFIPLYSCYCITAIALMLYFRHTTYFLIPYFTLLALVLIESFGILFQLKNHQFDYIYFIFFFYLLGFITLGILDDANLFYSSLSYPISISILIGDLLLYVAFFINLLQLKKNEEQKVKLLAEQDSLKALALQEQINPHMIFNTLSVIEDHYHQSIESGDASLSSFSNYLRYSINSMESTIVPFEKELDSISYYTDFQSQRIHYQIDILYNIDAIDFMLPPLTLKTILEQFYSERKKETNGDNMFEIASSENKKCFIVKLIDHRFGYNIDWEKDEIQNLMQRIHLTINGTVHFHQDEKMTEVIIIIPKK